MPSSITGPDPGAITIATPSNELLNAALAYAAKGWRVLPVHHPEATAPGRCSCMRADCTKPGKHPMLTDWPKRATTDPEMIRRWWDCWPLANVGLAMGDGLIDLECDPRHGGDVSLPLVEQRLGALPDTVTWISGGGGEHRLLRVPPNAPIRNGADLFRDLLGVLATGRSGIDLRSVGGFAVAPPSLHELGTRYRFGGLHPDAIEVAELPAAWLAALTAAPSRVNGTATAHDPIPEGRRNHTLAKYAGHLRRAGLSAEEMLPTLLTINGGRCKPPLPEDEVAKVAHSIDKYAPDQVTVAVIEDWASTTLDQPAHCPPSIRALGIAKPALRPALIDGVLRIGETMNVIAAPKVGKSWLVTDLALAVASGRPWLGAATERRDVLIIDNELHGETSANRIPKVANARGLSTDEYGDRLFVENLRGRLTDLLAMAPYFDRIPVGRYGLIVLDAFYRFLPTGSDENDNGSMASLYNAIDRHAERLGCSFALIHHSSKGNQSGKAITDVGAGAGAQSRATDSHLVLRPHEEPHAVVLDAAVRSWPPVQPQVLRWNFPVWNLAPDLDPNLLDTGRPRRQNDVAGEPPAKPLSVDDLIATCLGPEPRSHAAVIEAAIAAGCSERRATRLLEIALERGQAHRWPGARMALTQPLAGVDGDEPATVRDAVRALLRAEPELPTAKIAERCGVTSRYVRKLRQERR